MTRREFFASTTTLAMSLPLLGASRKWPLGINTYCLRFQRWNDRQLIDYSIAQKLDAIFLQDSADPGRMDPKHWAEVRAWTKEAGLPIETGGGLILPSVPAPYPNTTPGDPGASTSKMGRAEVAAAVPGLVAALRKNIERAIAMGSPTVRAVLGSDRYSMPPGPVVEHIETALKVLREVRSQVTDAGLKIAIENHKDLQAWETRQLIEAAGKDFVGSYLDTGNPVFVAEDPLTTIEELGPLATSFHLRDSVVYEHPEGIAVQWVPLGEGTNDFRALVARAEALIPAGAHIYCKPITARPPVILPVYSEEFWSTWYPRARSKDLGRFLALGRRGRPYIKPHIEADLPGVRDKYMDALKAQQMEHMQISLDHCKKALGLGVRAA